jgi:hypothetical protein
MIDQCAGNPKKVFRIVNSLSKNHQDKALPPYVDRRTLAENFGQFFYRKIELINEKIDQIDAVAFVVEHRFPEVKFESFSPVSDDVVSNIIMSSSNISCQLDPIPTWLLKNCCDVLSPIITRIIIMSLVEGIVPEIWKSVLVLPLLKKLGLDLLFENFRLVSNLPFVAKLTEKEVAGKLLNHCNVNSPLPVNQSAYRQFHSTETALFKVVISLATWIIKRSYYL